MVDGWVERFRREALPLIVQALRPSRVLLFGSRAAGNARPDSDLDVIVVADAFADIPFIERMTRVSRTVKFPKHVDYLCYTPEEFARIRRASSVLQGAMEHCAELPI
jgi:predicted nucleotidyltransferase